MSEDVRFMRMALELAREAGRSEEVPVGAVVVLDGEAVGLGRNGCVSRSDPTAHAEIQALRDAGASTGNYRLPGSTLYSSVEPCIMCMGALLHARVSRLVFGAPDPKVGAVAELVRIRQEGALFNHTVETLGGVLAEESSALLREFFRRRREACGEVPKWS